MEHYCYALLMQKPVLSLAPTFVCPGIKKLNLRVTSGEVNGARWRYTRSRPCALIEKKERKKNTHTQIIRPTEKRPRKPEQPSDTSRRHVMKHVPRVSPYLSASIDPEFVQIRLVQLSQSVKRRSHTYAHRQIN